MKISTQAIKFINEHYKSAGDPARSGVDALVKKIGAQLGAVEEALDFFGLLLNLQAAQALHNCL